jgi:HD-like signal output (HDOD) protein
VGLWEWVFDLLMRPAGEPCGRRNGGVAREALAIDLPGVATATAPPEAEGLSPEGSPPCPNRWWAPEGVTSAEPVETRRPEMTDDGRALESMLVQHLDGHDLTMPPMPGVPERVRRRLSDRRCNFVDVAEEISQDQVVAAAVLRAANSPLYRGASPITSLQSAVSRLGVNILRSLMMHQALQAVMFEGRGGDRRFAQMLWRRSLAGAHIMTELSHLVGIDSDEAFMAGLLHDVGNVIVLRVARDQRAIMRSGVDAETFEYLCYMCHQEFGELVADAWNLPSGLKSLVSNHHTRPGPDDPLRSERLMIHLSDLICSMLGYSPAASCALLESPAIDELGLAGRAGLETILVGLPERIEAACSG